LFREAANLIGNTRPSSYRESAGFYWKTLNFSDGTDWTAVQLNGNRVLLAIVGCNFGNDYYALERWLDECYETLFAEGWEDFEEDEAVLVNLNTNRAVRIEGDYDAYGYNASATFMDLQTFLDLYGDDYSDYSNNSNWTLVSNSRFGSSGVNSIAYGNNRFVAVGDSGKMAYSSDGVTWTAVSNSRFGSSSVQAVAYGGNRFVAVGDSGKMATSTDGASWTLVSNSQFGSNAIIAIAYGSNRFVAVGDSGKMATSTDGTTWTAVSNSTFGTSNINAIAYGNNKFVVGGENGKMATSTDGVTWTAVSNNFGTTISAIAFGNYRFVVTGNGGKMVYWTE
jgi:hypothetical protein